VSAGLLAHGSECGCTRCVGFLPGNVAAGKSLATSELALAPLRRELDLELAVDYPELDSRRRSLLADRLARVALAWRWLDRQPEGIVRDGDGRVFDVVDRAEKWAARAEQILGELEEERRGARPASSGGGVGA
jgi:hypothetical protein